MCSVILKDPQLHLQFEFNSTEKIIFPATQAILEKAQAAARGGWDWIDIIPTTRPIAAM
jgi:hypothetical protein